MAILKILGGLCILFGIVDFASYMFMGIDLTGVSWSPIVAFIVGGILFKIGGGGGGEGE